MSSFGIGGTNAHVVLEEAPPTPSDCEQHSGPELLVLSAKTRVSVGRASARLADHLSSGSTANLSDVAWTLAVGRQEHVQRRFVVASNRADAANALRQLESNAPTLVWSSRPRIVFMFAGQGGQRLGMARELYATQGVFREAIDRCAGEAESALGLDVRRVLYHEAGAKQDEEAQTAFERMEVAQVAIFAVEVAAVELWKSWGVVPDEVVGHSLGAYAAAYAAGVLSLSDAISLVIARSTLLGRLPEGAMLAVRLSEGELLSMVPSELCVAAVNGPTQCTVSGPKEAISRFEAHLTQRGVDTRTIHVPRAAHTSALDPWLGHFETTTRAVALRPPTVRWISDSTGQPVSDAEATDPMYFVRHLRNPVRFADALSTVFAGARAAVVEIGPSNALSNLARQHPHARGHICVSMLPHPKAPTSDLATALDSLGRLWSIGVRIDWNSMHRRTSRRRVPLPTYAFDHKLHSLDGGQAISQHAVSTRDEDANPAMRLPNVPQPIAAEVGRLFSEVLGLHHTAAPHENFFENGGDSLIATQLAAKLRSKFPEASIRARELLSAPTVAGITRLVVDGIGRSAAVSGARDE